MKVYIIDNLIGIISLVITLVGFSITVLKVMKTKKIVNHIRDDLVKIDVATECSKAISKMDEIKRLIRDCTWSDLPERFSSLSKSLNEIKCSDFLQTSNHLESIQSAVLHFRNFEDQFEKINLIEKNHANVTEYKSKKKVDVAKNNRIISEQIDKIQEILIEILKQIGGKNNG